MQFIYFRYVGILLIIVCHFVVGQDFSGSYFLQTETGGITIELRDDGQGRFSGNLSGNGISYQLSGALQDGMLKGTVGDELYGIVFQAQSSGDNLTFTMAEVDEFGNSNPASLQNMVLKRISGKQYPDPASKNLPDGQVVINNTVLSPEQIAELEKTYGIKPRPGKYWYDARCGLYGVVGYAAYGFMLPGHSFGALERKASGGNTGVLVNGRELPLNEYTVWSYMVGSWIQPGSYWLDANGNAGYEGNSTPVINLYAAAQQNAYKGQGGSGDNFWSTRFSAGNYDSDNQRGYVSVPGYGPVGYGF